MLGGIRFLVVVILNVSTWPVALATGFALWDPHPASGETQLKPFFFADEANFTATCIPPLNRFPISSRQRGQRAQRSPANIHLNLLALEAPVTTRCNSWPRECLQTNLAGGKGCENLYPMQREAGARYPRPQSVERPLVVSRLLLLGSLRRSLRAGAIRSECWTSSSWLLRSRRRRGVLQPHSPRGNAALN